MIVDKSQQRKLLKQFMDKNSMSHQSHINYMKLALLLEGLEDDTRNCIHQRKLNFLRHWIQATNVKFNSTHNYNWFINNVRKAKSRINNLSFEEWRER